MKCRRCGKEFDSCVIEQSKSYDRGDGVMYGTSVYSHNPICPHCGYNNTVKIFMTGRDKRGL